MREIYNLANSWRERKEILHKMAEQGLWDELADILPSQSLSDLYLKFNDTYYSSQNPHKVSTNDEPYLTQYQRETRDSKEFEFSQLSKGQLKEIEGKNVNIERYYKEIE